MILYNRMLNNKKPWYCGLLHGKYALFLLLSLLWNACAPNELAFQKFEPQSDTALSDLFNETPAIRAAFTTVDPTEFNNRMDKLLRKDPVMGVKLMHALGSLAYQKPGDRPALPALVDDVSSTVDRFARFYMATEARKDEYNQAMDVISALLDIDPSAITDGSYLGARVIKYLGENKWLYPLSDPNAPANLAFANEFYFPALTTWQTCDDPGSVFLNAKPRSHETDLEGRDTLWSMYDMLRTGYCIYANRTGPRVNVVTSDTGVRDAKIEAVVTDGVVTALNVIDPGSGYNTVTPILLIDSTPGPGSGATGFATVGVIQKPVVAVANGGAGYSTPPTITVSAADCPDTSMKFGATVSGGAITAIDVQDVTFGCTNPSPTLIISPPDAGGTPATVTVTMDSSQKGIMSATLTTGGSNYVRKNDDTPGAYMYNATKVMKNSGNVELRIRNLINDLQNNLQDFTDAEKKIADWTVNRSSPANQAQVDLVDYVIEHVYPITQKDFVFVNGKEVLDREAEHVSMLNPGGSVATKDEYLTEWLMKSLAEDAPRLDDLENFTALDTNSPLYKFGKDMVQNPTYGLNRVTQRYPKPKLKGHLYTGFNFDPGCSGATPSCDFKGLLASDGYIKKLLSASSTQKYKNPFRTYMSTRVNALVDVPLTYNNELYFESALKNLYYHLLERYYDQTTKKWAFSPEDAATLFASDPNGTERNLQSYIGQMQYSMRNMAILDKAGRKPGDVGFDNVPYLTSFIYTIAAANGFVDPVNAPAQLTLKTCLTSMGATDIADDGVRTISMPLGLPAMNSQVTNMAIADGIPASSRNDQPYSTSLQMFAFELLSPGRFIPRADTDIHMSDLVNGKFRGRFSPHQGDIESTKQKTSNWMVSEFALSAWEGYGPYSVKGKAANGSKVKYENDFYTDGYRSKIATGAGDYATIAMGVNGGEGAGTYAGNGNYHIYEMIYRPLNSGDPCWADAQGATYGYARYGYIRPQNNTSYSNVTNCLGWAKIRLDFDTRDEAIRANIEWVLKYKKYIFVIPMYGYTNMWTLWNNGAAFAVFSTIHGNGLWGITTGRRACSAQTCNGQWLRSGVSMGANGDGLIANSGNGFVTEASAGGQPGVTPITKTVRMGAQSYQAGDSMVLMEISFNQWGLTGLLVNVFQQIWDSMGDGPITPAMVMDNFDSVLALADAVYKTDDIMAGAVATHNATPTMDSFQKFYDTFFPTDETQCLGGNLVPGAGGGPDLFENFKNGCGITARELPPLPKVNPSMNGTCSEFVQTACIKYPKTYKADGSVDTWYLYAGPSDGKLTGMLTPLIMLFGTMHEDGQVMKVSSQVNDSIPGGFTPVRYNATALGAGEDRDSVTIRNFCTDGYPGCNSADLGYRDQLDTLFTGLASLNDSKMTGGVGANKNLPFYNTTPGSEALTNLITETAPGLRNGFVPKLTSNKYANTAYIDPLVRDLEGIIADNVRKFEDGFKITSGTEISGDYKNKDRLRYFATKNVINPEIETSSTTTGIAHAKYHGLEEGDRVYLTGSVPPGLQTNNPSALDPLKAYFVVAPVTQDTFKLSATRGGAAIAFSPASSWKVHPWLFRTNRFSASVNGVNLNGVPINMMKQFISYLRGLTDDVQVVNAIKAAIPVINNYLQHVQNSSTTLTLSDQDIDHIVDFVHDKNSTDEYSIDTFLDVLVSTKMDDLNTLRSFNFEQFKELGSYENVFEDINDKVSKYFDINLKKDILYSPFMLGEPTCSGGSQNGFYDHNEDGKWDPGTFTFISQAYVPLKTFTDTANVGGSCSITTKVPNIYHGSYYMLDMGGVARNMKRGVEDVTSTDIDATLNWLYGRNLTGAPSDVVYGPNPQNGSKVECYIKEQSFCAAGGCIDFDKEVTAVKNLMFCNLYEKRVDEPHYDRNGNNIIEAGEFTDVSGDGNYNDKDSAGAVNIRKMIHYYLEGNGKPKGHPDYFGGYVSFYNENIQPDLLLSPDRNYIHFAAKMIPDLLAPTRCSADGLSCAGNSDYVTKDLVQARNALYKTTNFTGAELKAVKNVIGNLLYDVDTNEYTRLFERIGPSLVGILREFEGDYEDLLNTGLEGFKPDGFMTYFSTSLTNKPPYTSLDILSDIRTLFNTRTMRCYPPNTGDSGGYSADSYCRKFRTNDTFWGQFGRLMQQFSTAAYNKYKGQWESEIPAPYFDKLVGIFE
ncbi:MAG TPA: hypothetical protein PLY93_02265 [Turneriella sp.]|nr:hypothetical protein [Turneriella sp.]